MNNFRSKQRKDERSVTAGRDTSFFYHSPFRFSVSAGFIWIGWWLPASVRRLWRAFWASNADRREKNVTKQQPLDSPVCLSRRTFNWKTGPNCSNISRNSDSCMVRGICPQNILIVSRSGSCLSIFAVETAADGGDEDAVGVLVVGVVRLPGVFMSRDGWFVVEKSTLMNKTRRDHEKKKTVTNTDEQRRRPSQGDETKNENEGTTETKKEKKVIQMRLSHNTRNHLIEIISQETWNVSEEIKKTRWGERQRMRLHVRNSVF